MYTYCLCALLDKSYASVERTEVFLKEDTGTLFLC